MDRNVLNIPVNRTAALFHPNKLAEHINAEAKPTALEMGVVLVISSPLSCDSSVSSCFHEKKHTTIVLHPFLCCSVVDSSGSSPLVGKIASIFTSDTNTLIARGNSRVMRKVTILTAAPRGLTYLKPIFAVTPVDLKLCGYTILNTFAP